MRRFPTNGQIVYIEEESLRMEEADWCLRFTHPEAIGEESKYDISFSTKYPNPKAKGSDIFLSGIFSNIYAPKATRKSQEVRYSADHKDKKKRGNKVYKLVNRPNFNSKVNTYCSCNYFTKDTERLYQSDVARIGLMSIDVDIHTVSSEQRDELLPKVLGTIMSAYYAGKLPYFNMINLTGAGLGFLLVYEKPVDAKNEEQAGYHFALFTHICKVIDKLFEEKEEFQIDGKSIISVDRSVINLNRSFRIPGTWNMRGERYATTYMIDDVKRPMEEHCLRMGVKNPQKRKIKDPKQKKEAKKTLLKHKKEEYVVKEVSLTDSPKSRNCAKRRLEQLWMLATERGGSDGDCRHHMLWFYWNCARLIYPSQIAVQLLFAFNEHFAQPLEEDSFFSFILGEDLCYVLGRDLLVDQLHLDKKETDLIGLFERQNQKDKQAENHIIKAEKRRLYQKLMIEDGLIHCKKSRFQVMEQVGISQDIFYRWRKELLADPEGFLANFADVPSQRNEKSDAETSACKNLDFSENKNKKTKNPLQKSSDSEQSSDEIESNNAYKSDNAIQSDNEYKRNNAYKSYSSENRNNAYRSNHAKECMDKKESKDAYDSYDAKDSNDTDKNKPAVKSSVTKDHQKEQSGLIRTSHRIRFKITDTDTEKFFSGMHSLLKEYGILFRRKKHLCRSP